MSLATELKAIFLAASTPGTTDQIATEKANAIALAIEASMPPSAFDFKASVRVISTTNITLSGAQTIDGIAVIAGDSVGVVGQTLGQNNGIYLCASGAWTRRLDAATSPDVTSGMLFFVSEGTVNKETVWVLSTNDPIILGTTVLVFVQFGGSLTSWGSIAGTLSAQTDLQSALDAKQDSSGKDASNGYAGLTLFKINFKNVLNTITSFFTNSNTVARTYTFQNRDGTISDDTDLALKQSTSGKNAASGYPGLDSNSKINGLQIENIILGIPIISGASITAGDVVEMFNGGVQKGCGVPNLGSLYTFSATAIIASSTGTGQACALSSSLIVVAYRDGTDTFGKVCCGTIAGTVITWGTPVQFNGDDSRNISICRIDDTKFFICYQTALFASTGIAGTVSGTTPTLGTAVAFEAVNLSNGVTSCVGLTSTTVLIAYNDGSTTQGEVVIASIAGTVVTYPTAAVVFDTNTVTVFIRAHFISSTKALLVYSDSIATDGQAIIIDVSGTTPTPATAITFVSSSLIFVSSVITLSSTNFFIVYSVGALTHGIEFILSGSALTYRGINIPFPFSNPPTVYTFEMMKMSSNKILFYLWADGEGSTGATATNFLYVLEKRIDRLVIITAKIFQTITTSLQHRVWNILNLSTDTFAVIFRDGNDTFGKGVVGECGELAGISNETGTTGDIDVIVQGIFTSSGLTIGAEYFSDTGDLSLDQNTNSRKIGKALSATKLLLEFNN